MDIYGHYHWRYTVQKHGIHAWSGLETKDAWQDKYFKPGPARKEMELWTSMGTHAPFRRPDLTQGLWGCPSHHWLSLTGVAFGYPFFHLRAPALRLEFSAVSAYYPASGNSR